LSALIYPSHAVQLFPRSFELADRLDRVESEFFSKLSPGQGAKEFVVKRKRFSVEQIVVVLKPAELGMPVTYLIWRVGISEQTFYRWKK